MPAIFSTLDKLIDPLAPISFTKLGFGLRKRMANWNNDHLAKISGKTIAITGPTSGLGKTLATELSDLGANLVLIARNENKLESLVANLTNSKEHKSIICDLLDIGSVRSAALQLSQLDRLDVLVNNAGTIFSKRTTASGIEATLFTHVIAPQIFQNAAQPVFARSNEPRVINIASGGMYTQSIDLDDLQTNIKYSGSKAYARAKRIQVDLAKLDSTATKTAPVIAMHPGWVDTPGLADSLPTFYKLLKPILRNATQGVDTTLWLCGTPISELNPGALYHDRAQRSDAYLRNMATSEEDRTLLGHAINKIVDELSV